MEMQKYKIGDVVYFIAKMHCFDKDGYAKAFTATEAMQMAEVAININTEFVLKSRVSLETLIDRSFKETTSVYPLTYKDIFDKSRLIGDLHGWKIGDPVTNPPLGQYTCEQYEASVPFSPFS